MARCTGILQVDLELFLASENSFLKRNVDNSAEVCSLHRSIVCSSSASAATEQVAENIAEDITHISAAKVEAAESAGSCAATAVFKCSVAKLIVPTGIDVELATEAFKRMGYQVEVVQIDWEEKKELVESGEIDCIMGCFSMEGRLDDYRWAGPYIASRQVVAVNENSDIYKLSDLEGKNLAVQSTTKPEGIFLNRTDERIPKLGNLISLGHRDRKSVV